MLLVALLKSAVNRSENKRTQTHACQIVLFSYLLSPDLGPDIAHGPRPKTIAISDLHVRRSISCTRAEVA